MVVDLPVDVLARVLAFAPLHQSAVCRALWQTRVEAVRGLLVYRAPTTKFKKITTLYMQGSRRFNTPAIQTMLKAHDPQKLQISYWDLDATNIPLHSTKLRDVTLAYSSETLADWASTTPDLARAALFNPRHPFVTLDFMEWIGHRSLDNAAFYAGPTVLRDAWARWHHHAHVYEKGPRHILLRSHTRPRAGDVEVFRHMFPSTQSISVELIRE